MMSQESFFPQRNFAAIPSPYSDWETSKVVVLPLPYDATTDWQSGARDAPRAIIDASRYLEFYDPEQGQDIYKTGIHTLPELEPDMSGPERMIERVYHVAKDIIQHNKFIVILGGEHSLTLGAIRAYREKFHGLSVLQLDAHADLRDSYQGTKFSHACVMRRVSELCPVVPVGVRSLSHEEHDFILKSGIKPFYAAGLTFDEVSIEAVISALSSEVYITIDLDVLDPSIMSAVGTPEPGGIGWYQILALLREVAHSRRVVGFDLMELCPDQGPLSCAYLAAKLAYKLTGYVFCVT